MSEVSRPSKRARISSEGDGAADGPPAPLDDLKHDEEFWLEDGNIVLIARNTAFRIYRGLLAAQSSIFADMFTAALSSKAGETYEGCPAAVVHLSESPEDLRHILRVLLPKSHRAFGSDGPQPTKVSFEQLFAVTRLSHKYQVDDILQQAISLLRTYYTTRPDCSTKTRTRCDAFTATQAIGAVNLARLTETPVILPRALFHCASIGPSILAGWTREDGTVEHLNPADVTRALKGRDFFIKESFYGLRRIFAAKQILRRSFEDFEPRLIFEPWANLIKEAGEIDPLCSNCLEVVRMNQEEVVRKIWLDLPGFFGLKF
ncbi:hypothetical protein LXA43DRAFT_1093523 [Ganoderma leucocontextum]|nr:hypothetical protein LXA43DRAFT_1093523 [Ganoderma leucocontextum]